METIKNRGSNQLQDETKRGWTWAILVFLTILLLVTGCQTSPNPKADDAILDYAAAFTEGIHAYYEKGEAFNELGMNLQAEYAFRYALSTLKSMDYALDCMLYQRGQDVPGTDFFGSKDVPGTTFYVPGTWDSLAALNYNVPWPYFFEGLVYTVQGDRDYAASCFASALVNPQYPVELGKSLMGLGYLSDKGLIALKESLQERIALYQTAVDKQKEIIYLSEGFEPSTEVLARNPLNYDDKFLRTAAQAYLQGASPNYHMALAYYKSALIVDPFDGDNYVGVSLMYVYLNNFEAAAFYIDEGLMVAKDHEGLLAMGQAFKAGGGKDE